MKNYLVQVQEVYIVSYVISAESEEDAIKKLADSTEELEEIDMGYLCDLSEYTNYSRPYIQEFIEEI